MIEAESSELLDNINYLIGKVNCLEIDNSDLRTKIEQWEKVFPNFIDTEVGNVPKLKTTILLECADNLEDCVKALVVRVGNTEASNFNLRHRAECVEERIRVIEERIKKIPPPVPPKPAGLNSKRSNYNKLKSYKCTINTEKENNLTTLIHDNDWTTSPGGDVDQKFFHEQDLDIPSPQSSEPKSNIDGKEKDKRACILKELLDSERDYIDQLESIKQGYIVPLKSEPGVGNMYSQELKEKVDDIFGNFEEIHAFHKMIFLNELEQCIHSGTKPVALCFTQRREDLHRLYSRYCQNLGNKEKFRHSIEKNVFLKICQVRLGHQLSLESYLIKPVQRITKYQLLIKELLSCSDDTQRAELHYALECMLAVLKCINESVPSFSVIDYPYDLSELGELLLQGDFLVKSKRHRELLQKTTKRHIFLYQNALMFCKKRDSSSLKETFWFKDLLKMSDINWIKYLKEDCRSIELIGKSGVYTIQAVDEEQKSAWLHRIETLLEELKINSHSIDDDDFSDSDDQDLSSIDTFVTPSCQVYTVWKDYEGLKPDELSIKEGDLVYLLSNDQPDWWFVRLYGDDRCSKKEGVVPSVNLKIYSRTSLHGRPTSNESLEHT